MKNRKVKTFVYEGLGFPIRLINVPMRKVFGEWVLDINFNTLHIGVLLLLVKRPTPLSGKQLRFIRHYFELSTREFAKLFGVAHTAVLKWENEDRKMAPGTEICIRLYVLDQLGVTNKEFRDIYLTFNPEVISKKPIKKIPLEVRIDEIAC